MTLISFTGNPSQILLKVIIEIQHCLKELKKTLRNRCYTKSSIYKPLGFSQKKVGATIEDVSLLYSVVGGK